MNPFEEKLRDALRRQEPPAGFAERVLAGVPARPEGWMEKLGPFFRLPALRWAMAAVFTCALLVTGVIHNQRVQRTRMEGEMARAQVMQALRIASVKLNGTRNKVNGIGRKGGQAQPAVADEARRIKG